MNESKLWEAYAEYCKRSGGLALCDNGTPFPYDPNRNAFMAGAAAMAEIAFSGTEWMRVVDDADDAVVR